MFIPFHIITQQNLFIKVTVILNFYKILMSIQNAKTHLQKSNKKPTESHKLAKSIFFEKTIDSTP
jgi:hypothetical protein